MKNIILTLLLLFTIVVQSQDYNKWSIEAEAGLSKLHGYTYVVPYNAELSTRYMLNTKFGLKLHGGYTDIKEYDFYNVGFHTVVNLGRVLNFETFTKHYTILAGVGATYTNSSSPILQDRLSMGHLSVFVDNLIKLTDKASLKIGMDFIGDINNRHFDVDSRPSTFSRLQNYNIGFVFNIGKQKEHADWYLEPEKEPIIYRETYPVVTNDSSDTLELPDTATVDYVVSKKSIQVDYVFFHNDNNIVDKDGLANIKRIADTYLEVGNLTIRLTGYASPPASNEYNKILAEKRCLAVKAKLISLGVPSKDIIIHPIGEITTLDGNNEDLARYVMLEIE